MDALEIWDYGGIRQVRQPTSELLPGRIRRDGFPALCDDAWEYSAFCCCPVQHDIVAEGAPSRTVATGWRFERSYPSSFRSRKELSY